MSMEKSHTSPRLVLAPRFWMEGLWRRRNPLSAVKYIADNALGAALDREKALQRGNKAAAEEYEILRAESDHRLLNGLQMVIGLLNMQANAADGDVKAQLSTAAQRVSAVERVHRRLHANDGAKTVRFDGFLEELCADFSGILGPDEAHRRQIISECEAVSLPAPVAAPLGFIASELLTNAIKYGKGTIRIRLNAGPASACRLVVSNGGDALPAAFDPGASKGLGMKIIKSFVLKIGGEFRFCQGEGNQGAQFTVLVPRESFVGAPAGGGAIDIKG